MTMSRANSQPATSSLQRLFPLHISERRVFLMLLDLLALNSALFLTLTLWSRYPAGPALSPEHELNW